MTCATLDPGANPLGAPRLPRLPPFVFHLFAPRLPDENRRSRTLPRHSKQERQKQ